MCGTTGYGMHGVVLAQPDSGLLALNESVDILSKMADAVNIPIICDAEGGYGNALNVVRTVKEYEKRPGVAGFFIEDQQQPPNCPFISDTQLISTNEMVGKIEAAVETRKDPDLLIIARTDAPYEEAVERANAYLDATPIWSRFCRNPGRTDAPAEKVHGPIHLGFFPNQDFFKGFSSEDCGKKLGYKIITLPFSVLFAQVAAELRVLEYIKQHGSDAGYDGDMIDFNTYIKLVHVDELRELGAKYLKE